MYVSVGVDVDAGAVHLDFMDELQATLTNLSENELRTAYRKIAPLGKAGAAENAPESRILISVVEAIADELSLRGRRAPAGIDMASITIW